MIVFILMSTENYDPKYQHEILNAELMEYSTVSKYQEFITIYLKFKYGNTENWFMLTEHTDKPGRLQEIKRFGYQYKVGDKFDFKFEIKSIPNKSNKLKIKSLQRKF